MKKTIIERLCIVIIILGFCNSAAMAQSREFPPGIAWQQVETEHFIIVFDAEYRVAAEKLAVIAEPIHQQVTGLLRYAPKEKTYVILTDHVDYSNGYATPVPSNKVALFLHEPGAGDAFFGLRSPDWLTMVFTHEYTHIVQMDMVNGIYKWGRQIFGRAMVPNAGLPMWMIEGLAVYTETKWQDGRGYHPNYDMMMRADVLDNAFKTLDQMAALSLRKWPMGTIVYLYGYFFTQYLADTYGEDRMIQLSLENSKRFPPVVGGNIFKKVYDGKMVKTLWEEWRAAMQQHYEQQLAEIRATPVTETTALTESGYGTTAPIFAPDGASVYYIERGAHDAPALVQLRLSDKKISRLIENVRPENLSLSADGQTLYFSLIDTYHTFSEFSDLYRFDIASRKLQRLTNGLRALDPAISPDGQTLVFVITKGGQTSLMRMDVASKTVTPLLEPADHTQLAHPAFSADGSKIALQVWKEGGFQDIYVMHSDGSELHPLTLDRATDSAPSWEVQDRYIVFSSDRTGVPNIFAYDLTDQKLYQVTNVLTGAFNPEASPDGLQMVMEYYSSNGLDIHLATLTPDAWQETAYTLETLPAPSQVTVAETQRSDVKRYTSFPSLLPKFWWPIWGGDEAGYQLGISTFGQDVLAQHAYSLSVAYGLESERASAAATYTNRQWYPALSLFGFDVANGIGSIFIDEENQEKTYWQREQGGGIVMSLPLYTSRKGSLDISTGYRYNKLSSLTSDVLTSQFGPPDEGVLSGISAGIALQTLQSSVYGISPERGLAASVTYRRDDRNLGSDFDLDTLVGDTRAYLKIPGFRHHVLALRATGGMSDGETLTQGIFQMGGPSFTSNMMSVNDQYVFLRGYKANAWSGNRYALGSAEYRFPLWYPQRGISSLFFDSLAGVIFYDVGNAWDGDTKIEDFKQGIGGELRINLGLQGGALPFTLRLGYAYGLDEKLGQSQFLYGITFDVGL